VLAYVDRPGTGNGPTEAITGYSSLLEAFGKCPKWRPKVETSDPTPTDVR
jgi:hypothetical protein